MTALLFRRERFDLLDSGHLWLSPGGEIVSHATRAERVDIAANLRLDGITSAFANDLPSPSDPPWTSELRVLWKLVQRLSDARGKNDVNRIDYAALACGE